ncbi:uncharacterized protein LOC122856731 isoform X2 [Aphidius gifuensis]|nr:uncharacterized protein LOC122856731 isoform X2 [Aphidius gifuensis]
MHGPAEKCKAETIYFDDDEDDDYGDDDYDDDEHRRTRKYRFVGDDFKLHLANVKKIEKETNKKLPIQENIQLWAKFKAERGISTLVKRKHGASGKSVPEILSESSLNRTYKPAGKSEAESM